MVLNLEHGSIEIRKGTAIPVPPAPPKAGKIPTPPAPPQESEN
jgi:hypothetical protein